MIHSKSALRRIDRKLGAIEVKEEIQDIFDEISLRFEKEDPYLYETYETEVKLIKAALECHHEHIRSLAIYMLKLCLALENADDGK